MKNKRFLSMVLCFVLVASLFTGFVSTASAEDVVNYVIKDGDYMLKVCKSLGLDYFQCKNAIMTLNNFTTDAQLNRLTIGQTIKLPASNAVAATVKATSATTTTVTTSTTVNGKTTTTTSTNTVSGNMANYNVAFYLIPHVVQYGETLASICNNYGTSYAQYSSMILSMNGIGSANNVWAGKTIYVPSTKAPSAGGFYAVVNHVVSGGETLTSICNNYGTSYAANSALVNGLNSTKGTLNKIYAGQSLYVPVVSSAINNASGNSASSSGTASAVQSGYNITINCLDGKGNAYATLDGNTVTKADSGKTVKIVPNAKSGFAQKTLKVTRVDAFADVVTTNNTFTMPPCDVTIDVTYTDAYAIARKPSTYGSFTTLVNGVEADFACPNDKVVLLFSPDYGYTCTEASYKLGGSTVDIKQDGDGTWAFVMPSGDITVNVTFGKGKFYNIGKNIMDAAGANSKVGSLSFAVDNVSCTQAAKNSQVVITASPSKDFYIDGVSVAYASNPSKLVTECSKIDGNHWKFKMPGEDVIVNLRCKNNYSYKLKDISNENGTISFVATNGTPINTAPYQGEVHVVFTPKSGYKYKEGSLLVTYADGKTKVDLNSATSFIMPGADTAAVCTWEKVEETKYNINIISSDNGKSDSWVLRAGADPIERSKSNVAYSGDSVQIRAYKNSQYLCTAIKVFKHGDEGTVICDIPGADMSDILFTMPAYDVDVIVHFEKVEQYVTIKDVTSSIGGSIYPNFNGSGAPNAKVAASLTLTVNTSAGYKLSGVYVNRIAAGKSAVKINAGDDGVYRYTVQAEDYSTDPASNVLEFYAQFEVVDAEHNINISGGSYTVSGATEIVAGSVYSAKNTQEITLTPSSGNFVLDDGKFELYSGSESSGTKTGITPSYAGTDKIVFTMPNDDVYVYVTTA